MNWNHCTPLPALGESSTPSPNRRAEAVLKCPPSQADEESFRFQHPLVIMSDEFPADDKMDQSQVGLKTETLDKILDKVFRASVEAKACFRSEDQDRIHMGALFPGFGYVIPRDRDMVAETKGVTYLVVARDEQGVVILADNGKPLLVEYTGRHDLWEWEQYKHEDKRWRCQFTTKLRNPALKDFFKGEGDSTDLLQIASVIEAKGMMSPEDIYQAGSSGCNELAQEFRAGRPVDRLYCFVWAKEEYSYGILDLFGLVKVRNHKIDPASFRLYEQCVQETRNRLGNLFRSNCYQKVPQTIEAMQALYDKRRVAFERQYDTSYPANQELLVGVFYRNPSMSLKMVTGKLSTYLTDAYHFIQGFMRVHVGNEFLGTVDSIFSQRLIDIRAEQREFFKSRYFERNMQLYSAELKTPTEFGELQEKDDEYILTLNLPRFAGCVLLESGPTQGDLVTSGMDVLRIYSNSTPKGDDCSLDVVFPFSSIEAEGIEWDSDKEGLLIRLPKKEPSVRTRQSAKRRKLLPELRGKRTIIRMWQSYKN